MAFEWFATGQYTYDQLRDRLTEAGFRSRPTRLYAARPVSRHTIEAMLRNRYYIGYVKWNDSEYQGRHQPLVSQDLFDRVQHVLANMPGAGNRQRRYHHYLKGLVFCRRCRRRLIVSRGKSKTGELYFYYVCRGRQDDLCDLPYIRVVQIEEAVASHYRTVSLPADLRRQLAADFDQASDEHHHQDKAHKAQLRKQLAELGRQEDRYIDLAADPEWPKAKLTQKIRDLRDQQARLEAQLNVTVAQFDQGRANARRILDYLSDPHALYARAGVQDRTKLNRILFKRLEIDITELRAIEVTGDELLEPFASVVYLRRQLYPAAAEAPVNSGPKQTDDVPRGNVVCDSQLLSLLEQAFEPKALRGSSKDTLAEVIFAYSNFRLPELAAGGSDFGAPGLLDQAACRAPLQLSRDDGAPPDDSWRITDDQRAEVRRLYVAGLSITKIAKQTGMAWSTAQLIIVTAATDGS